MNVFFPFQFWQNLRRRNLECSRRPILRARPLKIIYNSKVGFNKTPQNIENISFKLFGPETATSVVKFEIEVGKSDLLTCLKPDYLTFFLAKLARF